MDDHSRPSSPSQPPADLWSSILDSVSSSRSIPSKQILILGSPGTGKSSLASALLQKPIPDNDTDDAKTDFALGYNFADVRDDADEDTLARLSVYTVPSCASSYTALLPHFLPRAPPSHTPWSSLSSTGRDLQTWLQWVETWAKGDASRELEIVREENRERLQSHLQHYTEPSADGTPLPSLSSTHASLNNSTLLPLGPGTLTHNTAGVPIIVACTKADLIDDANDMAAGASAMGSMVKGKGGEWEERTDGVMQILRTICLKYGASLFYTTPVPQTLQVLRQHVLHLLFTPPAPSPLAAASATADAPTRNPFPFIHKPNTLDRDRIVVPAGWDSWGKIGVLRDGFEARVWGEAWERDLEGDTEETPGAARMYAGMVPDQGARCPPSLPPFNNPTPEQTFLARNYDENAKKPDRDPRGAFRNPADLAAAGIVGPLGSSSFSLPTVERALSDMEGADAARGERFASAAPVVTAETRRAQQGGAQGTRGGAAGMLAPLSASTLGAAGRQGAGVSPGSAGAGAGATSMAGSPTGQSQHEVLQNFFQSLLSSKDRAPAASPVRGSKGSGDDAPGSA
ncbi:dynein light intermediate chain-domain-containing protein [Infundibulicybe gibba]|nr:dynein light intermediate chain-domain-containing protein [Infundibulicybe gibba]